MSQELTARRIPIARLKVSKFNIRRNVGDISELVLSMKSVGVLEPIIARPIGKEFEVIIGSRRFAAARKAGLKSIPVIVKEMSDDEAIVESLTENLQRGDLTEEEIVAAYNFLHDFDPKRWTQEAFGERLGKSQQWLGSLTAAYQSLVKLRQAGIIKGMASHPREEERELGIAPVTHLTRIEEAIRSVVASGALSKKEAEKKRVELAKAVLDLPQEDALKVIDRFKMYPERSVAQIKEEALAAKAGVVLRTYLPPKIAKELDQIAQEKNISIEDVLPDILQRGLSSTGSVTEHEQKIDDVTIVTEIDTGYVFSCPVCKGKYRVLHNKPTNVHRFEELD